MLISITSDVTLPILFTDEAGTPRVLTSLPTFRIFGQNGPVTNAAGTAALFDSKAISAIITGATTTVTSTAHGLVTGSIVNITGATGTTSVNGFHVVTVIDANTFTFNNVVTSGTYIGSAAAWDTPGLYGCEFDSTVRSALEVGRNYLLIAYTDDAFAKDLYFTVVS